MAAAVRRAALSLWTWAMTETEHRDIIDVRMPDRRTKEKQVDPIRGTWPAWGDMALVLGIFAGGILGLVLLSVCGR
jgi:hypothetical protein